MPPTTSLSLLASVLFCLFSNPILIMCQHYLSLLLIYFHLLFFKFSFSSIIPHIRALLSCLTCFLKKASLYFSYRVFSFLTFASHIYTLFLANFASFFVNPSHRPRGLRRLGLFSSCHYHTSPGDPSITPAIIPGATFPKRSFPEKRERKYKRVGGRRGVIPVEG